MEIAKEKIASSLAGRCRGAIWGQFIGDAACLGSYLLNDVEELKRTFPEGVNGFESPKHGGKHSGDLTHYGDAALLMLKSVAELGYFSAPDFGPRFVSFFSSKQYQGHLDQATHGTLDNYRAFTETRPGASYHFQGGADDDNSATATRLAPVVVNRCQHGSLLKVVENATRVCQNNQRAVVYMKCHALIIKELLTGAALRDAVKAAAMAVAGDAEAGKELATATEMVFGMQDKEVREATKKFGLSSALKSTFPAAVHCALKHEGDFRRAILETANAGGDSAARAAMVGTWLGALHGIQGIPSEWHDKVKAKAQIERYVDRIIAGLGKVS